MRRIFWMIIFFGVYVWLMTSGNEQTVINQGRILYNTFIAWFDDAELDFQVKQKNNSKKKSRRWD